MSLNQVSLKGGRPSVLYHKFQTLLPEIPPEHLSLGTSVNKGTAWLWRTKGKPSAIIVRLHGLNATELPVWQDDVEFALKHHVDCLALCYALALTSGFPLIREHRHVSSQIEDALRFSVMRLGIPSDKTVLLGYSAGASEALSAFLTTRLPLGLIAFVGLPVGSLQKQTEIVNSSPKRA